MRAKDIMTSPVHVVWQNASVESAAELMTAKSVTALPVVDADGVLVGMVSESDLLWHRVPSDPTARQRRHPDTDPANKRTAIRLKFKGASLPLVIMISWGIAFFEYMAQVPANRIGYRYFNAAQLKTIQEIITLTVFVGFSFLYLNEPIKWNTLVGFGLMVAAAFFIFKK